VVRYAVLFGVLLSGCAVRVAESRTEAREERWAGPGQENEDQRVESAALEYIARVKKWRPDQFRLERERSEDPREARVTAVFLEDERRPHMGGGESVLLCIDRKDYRVVRELHFE
jgi:hypothetical protein